MPRQFNPDQHRCQSIRLRGWDYTTPGAYFITICTYRRENLFDDPVLAELAENAWRNLPTQPHARHIALDEWVVMPNHLHGILILMDDECRGEVDMDGSRGEAGRKWTPFADGITVRPASPPPDPNEAGQIEIPFTNEIVIPSVSLLPQGVEAGSVGAIIGNFKSLVTKRINHIRRTPGGKVWQRGYYDRIVRNERELAAIRQYIWDNPQRWQEDRDNLDALVARMRLVLTS